MQHSTTGTKSAVLLAAAALCANFLMSPPSNAADVGTSPLTTHSSLAASARVTEAKGIGTPDDPNCTITGTAGDDRIVGTPGPDMICAGLGDDLVLAKGGDDVVLGQGGDDRVRGGPGADRVDGARGDDTLRGGSGPDKLYGSWGRDALRGGPGQDLSVSDPMPNIVPWTAVMSGDFDLPVGASLRLEYVPGSGKCLGSTPPSWTITESGRRSIFMFQTSVPWPWDSCAVQPSLAKWNLSLTTPGSAIEPPINRTGLLMLSSGPPNPAVRTVIGDCVIDKAHCKVIGGASGGLSVTAFAEFGPVDGTPPAPTPSPTPPSLNCQPNFYVPVGTPLDEKNGHPCTVEGYPRPTVKVEGLPEGVTLQRWPTQDDTWLVLQGRIMSSSQYYVTVTTTLPSGWARVSTFKLYAR